MKLSVHNAIDARQSPQWGEYLKSLGWIVERIEDTQLFIHTTPLLKRSVIKIQHPIGPLPLKEIEKVAQKYRALFCIIEPHAYRHDEKALIANGYRRSFMQFAHTATLKIDLARSEKELFKSFSENAKRNIKKAATNNLELKVVRFSDDKNKVYFSHFYSLLKKLSKKKKFYAPSFEEYYKKMSAFSDSSLMLFAYEKNDDKPVAVVWLASYGKIITYMQTGITARGYQLLANYFLVWEGLKLAQKKGMKVFDFETLYDARFPKENKSWKGYSEFKKRFHGTLIEYPEPWIKIYNPFFKLIYSFVSIFH